MNKMILFGLMFFLALTIPTFAGLTVRYNQTSNTAGNSVWNETWTSAGNKTFYMNIPKNATVMDAKLNLSGYKNKNNFEGISSPSTTHKIVYSTSSNFPFANSGGTEITTSEYQNVSINDTATSNDPYINYGHYYPTDNTYTGFIITFFSNETNTIYVRGGGGIKTTTGWCEDGANTTIYMFLLNHSSNIFVSANNTTGTNCNTTSHGLDVLDTITNVLVNSNNFIKNDGNITLAIMLGSPDPLYCDTCAKLYISYIQFSTFYPSNPYLDVSGNGDSQWSFSGDFNQTNNQTSDFSSEINSYLKNCYPYVDGTCDVPIILHSDSVGIMQIKLNATLTYDTETFETPVYEGQNSTFWIKVNSTSDITDVNAWLIWNGTSYAYTTKQQSGSYWTFTRVLTIPAIGNNDINASFYWNFTYTNATSTYPQNFSSKNQTVNVLKLFNCTGGNITLNFTGYNEETTSLINYSMDSTFTYWVAGKSFTKNFSYEYRNNNTYFVCIAPPSVTIYSDATIKYWQTNYSTRYYYLLNATLDNATDSIKLYLLNDSNSTLITFRVFDEVENPKEDVLILIQRQYVGTGTFIQLTEIKTDFDGYAYTYLKLHETYKFYLIQNGVVVREYTPMQLETTSLEFHVSTATIPEYFSYYDKVVTSCSFSNSTNKLTCNYIDTSGLTMNMTLKVIRMGIAGDVEHCINYSTSSSGTFECQLTTNTSYRYSLTGTYYSDPTSFLWQSGWLNLSQQAVAFGAIGLLLSLIIVGILSFSAHWDVRIAIILTTFGMIFCVFIGLIGFGAESMGMILTIALLGGIVAYKIQT